MRHAKFFATALSVLVLAAPPAFAQTKARPGRPTPPPAAGGGSAPATAGGGAQSMVINSATTDAGQTTLFVTGSGFSASTVVTLGGTALAGLVVDGTGTNLTAALPASLAPGSYLLALSNGPASASFGLTLGAQGPQGLQGIQGATGATGAQGPQGAQGPAGTNGVDGAQGPAGTNGVDGAQGLAGTNGTNGVDGAPGATGSQGETGATGAQGPQGEMGPQGLKGDTGAQGPAGTNGVDGTNGADGATGPQGAQGPQGEPGSGGGAMDIQYNSEKLYSLPVGSGFGVSADCPAGTRPIGGGWQTNTIWGTALHVAGSFPQYYPDYENPSRSMSRWLVTVNNTGATKADIWVYAICTP